MNNISENPLKYKLICFDLDGTIIDETIFIWQTIHDALGSDKKKRKQYAEDFVNKKITYTVSCLWRGRSQRARAG